jgi:superfamily II DNA/RNA helicase
LFQEVSHENFQQIELFISESTGRLDKKQKATHKKKWENMLRDQQQTIVATNTSNSTDKLVLNLSNEQLSQTQIKVLSRGLNFAIVPERIPTLEIIKSV